MVTRDPALLTSASPSKRKLMRVARIVAVAAGVFVLLLVIASVALRLAYPPERVAALVAEHVSKVTGRTFRIAGPSSMRLCPNIAVEVNDISLSNADWGSSKDLLRARRVAFELSLPALLHRKIEVLRIDVKGIELALEADGKGRLNWQLAGEQKQGESSAFVPAPDGLSVADAQVSYRDARSGASHQVSVASLELKHHELGNHVAANLAFVGKTWKLDGDIGAVATLLAGTGKWPVSFHFDTEGAAGSVQGEVGIGPSAGTIEARVTAKLESAEALEPFVAGAQKLPMPVDLEATVFYGKKVFRAESLTATIAGQQVTGHVSASTESSPMKLQVMLTAPVIDASRWLANATPNAKAKSRTGEHRQLFDDTALPLPALPDIDADIQVKVQRLVVPGMPTLSALDARIVSGPGVLSAAPLNFSVLGGDVRGRLDMRVRSGAEQKLDAQLNARSLSVEAADALRGQAKRFNGGRVNAELKLTMSGRTPRGLAASSTGSVLVSVSDVALAGTASTLDQDIVSRLLDALIPRSSPRDDLIIRCAVVRLPLRSGVAQIDRSIAIETQQIGVSASGKVDLAKQVLTLAFVPRVKKGLNLNVSNLVQMLQLSGPLESPQLTISPMGAAREAATLAAAGATGGLTLLAPALRGDANQASACEQAARGVPAGSKIEAPAGRLVKRQPIRDRLNR
ncbi:AsmA family protein [Variovorax saccharolyticus]|uniref:AsmA family protein n=1 Tax=Variovorax saccharolyticus TaxID=3053516 RepID=UPI002575B1AE|nr:AsmA family protein [Variovorax sp. J31P216]